MLGQQLRSAGSRGHIPGFKSLRGSQQAARSRQPQRVQGQVVHDEHDVPLHSHTSSCAAQAAGGQTSRAGQLRQLALPL